MSRTEDAALLAGRGCFTDDETAPGLLHGHLVRSPVAHGIVTALDVTAARRAPGVAGVFTAADLRHVGPLPGPREPPELAALAVPLLRAAGDEVRWAGQPVALVVAATPAQAADAAELVQASYEPRPAVTRPEAGEVCLRERISSGDTAAAFARAAHRVRRRMEIQRIAPAALEPRGVLARQTPEGGLIVRISTQRPHDVRGWLAAMFGLPEDRVRVLAGDIGGGFGAKGPLYPDQVAVIAAACLLGRPVKWIEERGESFLATTHGRGQVAELELAVTADGRVTALRGTVHAGLGAYLTPNAPNTLTGRLGRLLGQCYAIEAIDVELIGTLTNATPVGPYRGAGRPEAAYFTERLMDLAAAAAGLDPAELRRRNLIPPDSFPYQTCTGLSYDSGNYPALLDRAMPVYRELREQQARARAAGRLAGVGICCFVEPGGIMPGARQDEATVSVRQDGTVTVAVGTSGHGQGHQTAFGRLAARLLGVPPADVTVTFGDTASAPFGYGTFGSRSTVAGGSAVYAACQEVLAKARRTDAPMPVTEAARLLGGISATAAAAVTGETFASGCYVCAAEVDQDTGQVRITRFFAVDDCGRVLDPVLVEGQVHGGVAQGVGQALYEQVVYDQDGQPLTASLLDYAIPAAGQVPHVGTARLETPSPRNPLGVKGMGESGTIGAVPAVVSAVLDALRPLGIEHLDTPLTPEKVWTAIRRARQVY